MAIVGIKLVTVALVDERQQLLKGEQGLSDDGLYYINNKDLGTKQANITGLTGGTTKIYGNNTTQDISTGTPAPSVALDINNLDFIISQRLKGLVSDEHGGWTDQKIKQHVAMLLESQTIDRKHSVWYAFGNGFWKETEKNLQTDDDNEHRVDDAPTYTALDCVAFGNVPYKIYSDIDDKFDKTMMLKEVFGGYVATAESSAGDVTE